MARTANAVEHDRTTISEDGRLKVPKHLLLETSFDTLVMDFREATRGFVLADRAIADRIMSDQVTMVQRYEEEGRFTKTYRAALGELLRQAECLRMPAAPDKQQRINISRLFEYPDLHIKPGEKMAWSQRPSIVYGSELGAPYVLVLHRAMQVDRLGNLARGMVQAVLTEQIKQLPPH